MKSYKLAQYTRISDQTNQVALWVISAPCFDILKHGSITTINLRCSGATDDSVELYSTDPVVPWSSKPNQVVQLIIHDFEVEYKEVFQKDAV